MLAYTIANTVLFFSENIRKNLIFAISTANKVIPLAQETNNQKYSNSIKYNMSDRNSLTITQEHVDGFISDLQDVSMLEDWHPRTPHELPEKWREFFDFKEIKGILQKALNATCAQGHVSMEDFKYALFEYTLTDYNWISKKSDDHSPESFLGFFKKTVRNLLSNVRFMREYFGLKLAHVTVINNETGEQKQITQKDNRNRSFDDLPENSRPLSDTLPSQDEGKRADEKENLRIFLKIANSMLRDSKKPILGELLIRYCYQKQSIPEIAKDYLRRCLIKVGGAYYPDEESWTPEILESAKKNVLNSMLPRARKKFDAIAIHEDFDYRFGK